MDFENLDFDEKHEENRPDISGENMSTTDNRVLQQEVTGQAVVIDENIHETLCDKDDFQGVGVTSVDKAQEKCSTSSEGEEDDEEEETETGKLSISACYVSEFCDGEKEDRIFAEGQPLPLEGDENTQVRNEEQGESQGEVMFYFESEHSRGMRKVSDGVEDQQEMDEEDYKSESTKTEEEEEEEENDVALCFEQGDKNPQRDDLVKDGLEFISVQQWQDLIVEVGCEQAVEKINNFSEEEHQEAGESFAEYPSDFSLCDYVEDEEDTQESSEQFTVMQDSSDEERVEYLYGVDLGVLDVVSREGDKGKPKIVEKTSGDAGVLRCETGDSHSSSHHKAQEVNNSDEELYENPKDHKTIKQLEELLSGNSETFPTWSTYDDYNTGLADFDINWNPEVVAAKIFQSDDLLAKEDVYKEEIPLSGDISTCSVTEDIRTTNPSKLGSLDDSFFFNADIETYGTSDLDQLGDEEYEEERNWEQEQERIKAFYKFYDDSGRLDLKEGG